MSDTQKTPWLRKLRYRLEAAGVYIIYFLFSLLPAATASDLGGWIGRSIGPRLPSSAVARRNLARAFPEKSAAAHEEIVAGMWDNLGRVMAEYPHIRSIQKHIALTGREQVEAARDSGRASIFFTAHLANWEIGPLVTKTIGLDTYPVYRRPNNPWVDGLLRRARGVGAAGQIEKGAAGAREMLKVLRKNGMLGIMMDQKLNEGMAVPFFGRPAMTAPAIATFALRFQCPVYPVRLERLGGIRFKMTVYPPLSVPHTGDPEQDVYAILADINRRFEDWIRERPEQWLWIHRRWPD